MNEVVLPPDDGVEQLCSRLRIDRADRESTLAARPDPGEHPELWRVLERSYQVLLAQLGRRVPGNPAWAPLPAATGAVGRHLFVWVFLAVVPHVRDYHATIGLTDRESWDSLGALGEELELSRRLTGRAGLDATWGLPLVFSGTSFRLGRLAFERQPPGDDNAWNTHVPGDRTPLTSAACDASFARAMELAEQCGGHVDGFVCHSWLMDDQLQRYLPTTSNIIRFQQRFTRFTDRVKADWAPIEHVFHRRFDGDDVPPSLLDELPQRTTLERAVVTHLRYGGHWYNRTGWMRRRRTPVRHAPRLSL
ncbi:MULTISPECIES: acyltransferase domain-containing protein [Kribbella]|uniref:Acyltransferase domain-containing protein n=1 Tax=Kribbella karoonensis TaxID=324851 RepID=A0ABN2EG96_9ACTN